jgi:thiamine kinase-like enzyme
VERRVRSLLALIPAFRDKKLGIYPIEGGLTNHNFRIEAGGETFVMRLGGSDAHLLGIAREQELLCARAAAAAGIGPEVIAFLPEHEALVTRFVSGRLLAAEDAREPATLRRLVETLRKCHASPAPSKVGSFSPFQAVRDYYKQAQARNVPLPSKLDDALSILAGIERALENDEPPCLCHNDLLPTNFIDDGESIYLIDWEYAGLGDRFFDLGNLAVNFQLDSSGEAALLTYYFGAATPEYLQRLRLMRLASDMRESLWGYLQAGISRLYTPDYYLEYGKRHLDRFLVASSRGV